MSLFQDVQNLDQAKAHVIRNASAARNNEDWELGKEIMSIFSGICIPTYSEIGTDIKPLFISKCEYDYT